MPCKLDCLPPVELLRAMPREDQGHLRPGIRILIISFGDFGIPHQGQIAVNLALDASRKGGLEGNHAAVACSAAAVSVAAAGDCCRRLAGIMGA